jgi:hypothetical protein
MHKDMFVSSFEVRILSTLCLALLLTRRRASAAFAHETANIDLVARLIVVLVHVFDIDVGKIVSILFMGLLCA